MSRFDFPDPMRVKSSRSLSMLTSLSLSSLAATDVMADNGVIHVIDSVVLPK